MTRLIKFNKQEMEDYLPIIQNVKSQHRVIVKLNKEISGLLVTIDGDENEIESYLNLLREYGIEF